MPPTNILGIILSLISAASWGGGDFFGGLSTRKHNQYAVLVISALAGVLILIICTLIWPEPFPAWPFTLLRYWPGHLVSWAWELSIKGYPWGTQPLSPRHRL